MAGEEARWRGWKASGYPGTSHRLVMIEPEVRLVVHASAHVRWEAWMGWPGGASRSETAADEDAAKLAAEAAAADLLRQLAGRCAAAIEALDVGAT